MARTTAAVHEMKTKYPDFFQTILHSIADGVSEPVIYPDGFDKFTGGELQSYLNLYDVDTLIITGYRSNISVLNTATKATRELGYKVIIPMDGITAKTDYEQKYTLFHFTVLPIQAAELFTFTMLDMIGVAEDGSRSLRGD